MPTSPLVDRSASLSGGQRQRLALARALMQKPAMLLLDEATRSLDAITERRVQESLDALRCTRSVIAELPESPSGQPVGESQLEDAVGGATRRTMPLRSCMDVCWPTDIRNA